MPRTRPLPIHHSYQGSIDTMQSKEISDFRPSTFTNSGSRLQSLSNAQDALIAYAVRVTGIPCCLSILMVALSFPLSMVAMGAWYFQSCPANPHITIYLVVEGGSILLFLSTRYVSKGKHRGYVTLLLFFVVVFFITGSLWIFKMSPNYDENSEDYCYEYLYLFAFWVTIAQYIFLAVLIIYLCIICQLAIVDD